MILIADRIPETAANNPRPEVATAANDFRKALYASFHLPWNDSSANRAIHITSFTGAYGVAGYVLCVEGTPPWGTVVFNCGTQRVMAWYGRDMLRAEDKHVRGSYRGNLYRAVMALLRAIEIDPKYPGRNVAVATVIP